MSRRESYRKPVNTFCEQNEDILGVKESGIHSLPLRFKGHNNKMKLLQKERAK
jgi:hypothetical protein